MNKKWLAVGSGIVYTGDLNKLRLAIFREEENHRAYPKLVKTAELQLNDLMFLETADRSGYCRLEDFHRTEAGEIDYWVFSDSAIPVNKQASMMKLTRALLDKEFVANSSPGETLLISIKQKPSNNA